MLKKRGPKTVPCGTPRYNWIHSEVQLRCNTVWMLYLRKQFIIDIDCYQNLVFSIFREGCRVRLNQKLLKDLGKRAAQTSSLSLTFFRMLSVAYKSASVVENFLWKPYCVLLSNLCCERYSDICSGRNFSNNFADAGVIDIGL